MFHPAPEIPKVHILETQLNLEHLWRIKSQLTLLVNCGRNLLSSVAPTVVSPAAVMMVTLCAAGAGAVEPGAVAQADKELVAGEAVMRMPLSAQPQQMPYPGMPLMHLRPGMPGMPPNFRGMMMPFVSLSSLCYRSCERYVHIT